MKRLLRNIRERPVTPMRKRAEDMVRADPPNVTAMTKEEAQCLVFELQVHHVELQLQNQELRTTQLALATSRDRYAELYEFAPVGYVTLNPSCVVIEANLTAAVMLGVTRDNLVNEKFSDFVAPDGRPGLYRQDHRVYDREGEPCLRACGGAIRTRKGERTSFYCPVCQSR